MKHYIYLSDSKVDMLFAQIPRRFLSTLSAEVKVNFGVFEANFKEKNAELDRYSKLAAVVGYLERENKLGDLVGAAPYFHGELEMRWGLYEKTGFVYFTGRQENTLVGLGGSLRHVLGSVQVDTLRRSSWGSATVGMKRSLKSELRLSPLIAKVKRQETKLDVEDSDSSDWELADLVGQAYRLVDGTRSKVDFVALRLSEGAFEARQVVLGTPLYVAYAS